MRFGIKSERMEGLFRKDFIRLGGQGNYIRNDGGFKK